MARILSRRADGAPPPADASPADQPTVVVPAQTAGEEVAPEQVAGVAEPEPAPAPEPPAPSLRNRGALRRRLRYLRRVREIAFRDLGGLVFDLDRFERDRPDLVAMKLEGLKAIDAELRALEDALDDVRPIEVLHEPGLTACAHCGALHGSEARFCPSCGTAAGTPAEVGKPETDADEAPAQAGAPAADAPAADAPPTDAPPTDTLPADTPPTDAPPADTPPTDAPPADAPPKA